MSWSPDDRCPRACSLDELVTVADRVCARTGAVIIDYSALAAAAAVPGARINGVPVHSNPRAAAEAMAAVIETLAPLDTANKCLSVVAARVYLAR